MRDQRMDRFSILPFSIGCASQSSVDVVTPHTPKKSETDQSKPSEELDDQKLTKSSNLISDKLQKMVKSFKSLPQVLIQLHREGEEEEEEEEEEEMEIGLPTDVQHVAHIGWDGSNTSSSSSSVTNSMINTKSWDRAPELLSFTSLFQPAL